MSNSKRKRWVYIFIFKKKDQFVCLIVEGMRGYTDIEEDAKLHFEKEQ